MISISAESVRSWIVLSSSRIWAWIVTSRAVVGSSAMSSFGSHDRAIAIITRWRMPPDISCGYCLTRRSGDGMPTRPERLDRPVPGLLLADLLVELDLLGDLVADREDRVQARQRLLEDHRDVVAADLAHLVDRHRQDLAAVEPDLALDDLGRRDVEQAHDRERGDALAGAGLADDARASGRAPRLNETPSTAGTTPSMTWKWVRRLRTSSRTSRGGGAPSGAGVVERLRHARDRGSNASRRPSPTKFTASTVRMIAKPGKNGHHQLP